MTQIQERFARIARHNAETAPAASKTAFEAVYSNPRAMSGAHNMGKVTRFVPHGDDCSCIPCRRALILEQRSMAPLSTRDKVYVYGSLWAGGGILVLFLIAASVS